MDGRSTTLATEGMVATPHYLASVAGLNILQSGGNAVDAAIAANAVLNVVYPHMCSVAGDAFFLIWDPGSKALHALNGSGRAPAKASIDALHSHGFTAMPERGAHAVTVPGAVNAWATVLERFGSRSFDHLLQPAIRYAEQGFPVTRGLSSAIERAKEMLARQEAASRQFLPGGRVPEVGHVLRQPDLGRSLRLIAEKGADAFYGGPIGQQIVETIQSNGGLMTEDDLTQHHSNWVQPISTTYRGAELVEMPPPTQGVIALMLANIVEGFDVRSMGQNSAEQVHHFVEAKKLAFLDRDQHITDPDFYDVPVDRLISKEYCGDLCGRINPARAWNDSEDAAGGGDTIYLCVVDRDGLCVSLIQSIFQGFGSGLVADGAGMILQNRGASFSLDRAAANRLEPRKRPMHTLIPAMLMRDGRPETVIGTMGGHAQAQIHLQLLSNLVDFEMEPQAAISAPRWVSGRDVASDPAHVLLLERRFEATVVDRLRDLGHHVQLTDPFSSAMGHAQMITIDHERGVLHGGADPRADGAALGW